MEFREYFKSELEYLKQLAEEYAQENPELAPFLMPFSGEKDVETLFEHFAFLSGKLHQKLDDAFPELTQPLLSKIFPLPLRPLPATAILKCIPKNNCTDSLLKKGAEVKTFHKFDNNDKPQDVIFQFSRDLNVIALEVSHVETTHMPEGLILDLECFWFGDVEQEGFWRTRSLTFYLGESSHIAGLLKLWFYCYLENSTLTTAGQTYKIASLSTGQQVREQNRATPVLPVEVAQYQMLQLIPEYFSLPNVHDFLTLDMRNEYPLIPMSKDKRFTLRFQFNRQFPSSYTFSPSNFQLNCVPIINLFRHQSTPQRLEGRAHRIEVPKGSHFYSVIDVVAKQKAQTEGDRLQFKAYTSSTEFSPRHHNHDKNIFFYQVLFKEDVINQPYSELRFLDAKGNEVEIESDETEKLIQYSLLCINSGKIKGLGVGEISSKDEAIPTTVKIRNITQVTAPRPPYLNAHQHWRLISHLLLSPSFLSNPETIGQVIRDFDLYSYAQNEQKRKIDQQLKGIKSAQTKQIDRVFKGLVYRGLKLDLTFDSTCFDDEGEMYRLACLIAEVFAYCISTSYFLLLEIIQEPSQEKWEFPPTWGQRSQI